MGEVFGQYPLHYMVSPDGDGILIPEDEAQGEQMGVTQTFHMDMIDTMRARAEAYGYMLVAVPYVSEVAEEEPATEVKLPVAPVAEVLPTVQELQVKVAQALADLRKAEGEDYP